MRSISFTTLRGPGMLASAAAGQTSKSAHQKLGN